MERKYPAGMFWFFVLMNFLFHFLYLSVPGIILCFVGILVKPCLWIGLAILGLDAILSIIDQLRIRKTVLTPSGNPEFDKMMDECYGPEGLDAIKKMIRERNNAENGIDPDGNDG